MSDLAALYLRQSVEHAEGIDRQRERTRKLAESRGWTVVATFEDNGASAFKTRGAGTGWGQMLAGAARGDFKYVIAVDLDRLLRGQADLLALIESGARVVTVDGELDLGTADGEFRATMTAALARFEVRRKSERQKRANAHRSSVGRPVPGRRRYGYETDGVTPREAEAQVVRRVFEHVGQGGSLYGLAQTLNAEAVPSPARSGKWDTRRLRDMCRITAYGGQVEHLGAITDSAEISQIVPREQAVAVRAIIADPKRRTTPGSKPVHLLSSIALCGVCGSVLTARQDRYMCADTKGGHVSIFKSRLDSFVIETVGFQWRIQQPVEVADTAAVSTLLTRAADLAQRRTQATEMMFEQGIDRAVVRKRLAEIEAESEKVEAAIIRERGTMAADSIAADARAAWVASGADNAEEAGFRAFWDTLDLPRQRDIIRSMFQITVNPNAGRRGEAADFDRTTIIRLSDGKAV